MVDVEPLTSSRSFPIGLWVPMVNTFTLGSWFVGSSTCQGQKRASSDIGFAPDYLAADLTDLLERGVDVDVRVQRVKRAACAAPSPRAVHPVNGCRVGMGRLSKPYLPPAHFRSHGY